MVPLGVSFNLLIEDQVDLSAILDPFDSNWFILCPQAVAFKNYAWPFSPVSIGDLGSLKLDQWMGCVKPDGGTSVVATSPDPCHYLAQGCYVTVCDLAQGWAGPGSQGHAGAVGVGMLQGKDSLMYSKIQKTHTMGCVLSCFSHVQIFATLWAIALQASLSMGFSKQEYWSGLPCPPPEDLPDPGIEPMSLMSPALAGGFFTLVPPGKPNCEGSE